MKKTRRQSEEEYVKAVIWNCSSGINKRKTQTTKKEYLKCWKLIKKDFYQLTQGYIQNMINW